MLCLADDITGTADCGAACVLAGLESLIIVRDRDVADPRFDAVVIGVHSRSLAQDTAAKEMVRCFEHHFRPCGQILYQKMDSTLRGNWPAELRSLFIAFQRAMQRRPLAVVAPAFPEMGRATVAGRLEIDDTGNAAALQDPTDGDLVAMLADLGIAAKAVSVAEAMAIETSQITSPLHDASVSAVVFDARSHADLDRAVSLAAKATRPVIWVSSADLLRRLAPALSLGKAHTSKRISVSRPMLHVIGSMSDASRAQMEQLERAP